MTDIVINKNIEKSAREMRDLIVRSKKKLLEIETLMSIVEISQGKHERFDNATALVNSLR